jgi:hypothetical protein
MDYKLKEFAGKVVDKAYEFGGKVADKGRELAVGATLALPVLANAQTAGDPFTDVMTTATTKVGTYSAALVVLAGVGVAFMIAMKYVKRIPRAS